MDGPDLQRFIDRYNDAWNAHAVAAIVAMHTEDSVFENHTTGEIESLEQLAGRADELLLRGVDVAVERVEYLSTQLTEARFAALRHGRIVCLTRCPSDRAGGAA